MQSKHSLKQINKLVVSTLTFVTLVAISASSFGVLTTQAVQNHLTKIKTSTYLGGVSNDFVGGIEYTKDGFLLAGINTDNNFGLTPKVLDGGGNGAILKLDSTGTKVLGVTRVAEWIDDLKIDPNSGRVAVATNDGIKVLSSSLTTISFQDQINTAGSGYTSSPQKEVVTNGRKVSFGQNGNVAFLSNKQFRVYDTAGKQTLSSQIGNTTVNTILLDTVNESIYLGGMRQYTKGACKQYKSPYIRAFGYNATEKYNLYSWTIAQVYSPSNYCADTEIMSLSRGRDGGIYMVAKSDGGNSVLTRNPKDLTKSCDCMIQASESPSVPHPFTSSQNAGGAPTNSFIFKYTATPTMLTPVKGQTVVARKSDGKTNSYFINDVKADADGTVAYIATSAASFAHRNLQRITIENSDVTNQPLGIYSGGDANLVIMDSTWKERKTGTAVTKNGGNAGLRVAIKDGKWAYLGRTSKELYTGNAIQPKLAGGEDVSLVTGTK
jgi:hypothetical protein